jgi:hypothetical protein
MFLPFAGQRDRIRAVPSWPCAQSYLLVRFDMDRVPPPFTFSSLYFTFSLLYLSLSFLQPSLCWSKGQVTIFSSMGGSTYTFSFLSLSYHSLLSLYFLFCALSHPPPLKIAQKRNFFDKLLNAVQCKKFFCFGFINTFRSPLYGHPPPLKIAQNKGTAA